jgi:rhomboid domain-containing protein 1
LKMPSVHGACTSNNYVLNQRQWFRLCTSSFYHLDDMHLYYNMISFIWKGMTLENKMGSKKFAIVITLFSLLTQVVMLAVNKVFAEMFTNDQYLYTCAAGFSAVIFSLKVLTTYSSNGNVNVMGMPLSVPSRYACWVELVLIHYLVPNSSFTGHLSGILVGLLYTFGPLKKVVKAIKHILFGTWVNRRGPAPYTRQAEATGYRDNPDDSPEIQEAIRESLRNTNFMNSGRETNSRPPAYGWNIPNEPGPPQQNNLYPNIPPNSYGSSHTQPSAPPLYDDGGNMDPPYPTSSDLPYPSPNDEERMRQARLRRFQNN